MTDTSVTPTAADQWPAPETIISNFEQLVSDTAPDGQKRPKPLWYAWHYLQVYSYWGLRLPSTEDDLKLQLGIKEVAAYPFFNSMVTANKSIHDASANFLNDIFPDVIKLGKAIKAYANDVTSKKGGAGTLSDIATLPPSDALILLDDLQSQATKNAKEAEEVTNKLTAYKTCLADAQGRLTGVKTQIETGENTSQATIDKLNSSVPGAAGSIAALRRQVQDNQDAYNQDVIIATTTLTYCWVPVIGQVSSVVVATVYGVRATEMLDKIKALQAEIEVAEASLRTAVETHRVQSLAEIGVANAVNHTNLAITYATTMQNTWSDLSGELEKVKTNVSRSIKFVDRDPKLGPNTQLVKYTTAADEAWGEMIPDLELLLDNPYISVESGEFTVSEFSDKVQKVLADQTNTGK